METFDFFVIGACGLYAFLVFMAAIVIPGIEYGSKRKRGRGKK